MDSRYLFFLGAVPELSEAELRAVCLRHAIDITRMVSKNGYIVLQTTSHISAQEWQESLGGVVYIAEGAAPLGKDAVRSITQYLLAQHATGKMRFGLSGVQDRIGIQVKKELAAAGLSARYVPIKNMASIVHNNLVERGTHLTVHDGYIYVTRAVHDFEAMATFDEERPAVDSKSGMLPPKLARMMINIAGARATDVLLDPFCGSGTVLLEAIQLQLQTVRGSDISEKAVEDTVQNIEWYVSRQAQPLAVDWHVEQADVRKLRAYHDPDSIDCIVTEPFMGAPKKGNERSDTIDREVQQLRTLFYDMLREFAVVLRTGGVVVFSKPRFFHNGAWKIIDWNDGLADFGFAIVPLLPNKEMLLYAREGQLVGREIWKLEKLAKE